MSADNVDVLIVGAGPTGLVLAIWLTHLGVRVRIIDKTSQPGTTSRALAVQARTLEFYDQLGLADAVVERGREVTAANIWVKGKKEARAVLGEMGKGISRFSFALIYPQDEHEQMLIDRLAKAGVQVERETELLGFEQSQDRIQARVKGRAGIVHTYQADYIAGCDGGHSRVRDVLQIGFAGGTYEHLFYVADVEARSEVANGELHVGLDEADFLAVFPLAGENHLRLVGTVREDATAHPDPAFAPDGASARQALSWEDVGRRVIEWMRIDVERVHWFSTYHVHHRVADRFRLGRAFLLGDAAHVHSPVGGQGMNTGIGDAINLAWKLASVIRRRAEPAILDTYEPERIAFARRLVSTTDQAFTAVTSSTAKAKFIRLRVVPVLFPLITLFEPLRRFMFRTISQTQITYRGSGLSEGAAGGVRGGDRLPWLERAGNFAPLTSVDWQVHVYGEATAALREACAARRLPLHTFAWQPEMNHAGLKQNAAYLIRPDGYVGLADPGATSAALERYLDARKISA